MSAEHCKGHPAGPFDPMGVTVYCDGTCRPVPGCAYCDNDSAGRWEIETPEHERLTLPLCVHCAEESRCRPLDGQEAEWL